MKTRRYPALVLITMCIASVFISGQCQEEKVIVSLSTSGAITEGRLWNDLSLNTYFKDVSKLYFIVTFGNTTRAPKNLSKYSNAITLETWKRLLPDSEGCGPRPVGDSLQGKMKMIGQVRNIQRRNGGGFYDRIVSGQASVKLINPGTELHNLIELIPASDLSPGDYVLMIGIVIDKANYKGGTCFRIREFQKNNPDDLVKLRKQQAQIAAIWGNLAKERKLLEQAVKEAPISPWGWYFLGEYLIDAGDFEKALKILTEASSKFPCSEERLAEYKFSPYAGHFKEPATGNWILKTICFEPMIESIKPGYFQKKENTGSRK